MTENYSFQSLFGSSKLFGMFKPQWEITGTVSVSPNQKLKDHKPLKSH